MNCTGCVYMNEGICGEVVFIKPSSSGGRYEKVSDRRCKKGKAVKSKRRKVQR